MGCWYLRSVRRQPKSLKHLSMDCWIRLIGRILRVAQISKLGTLVLPASVQPLSPSGVPWTSIGSTKGQPSGTQTSTPFLANDVNLALRMYLDLLLPGCVQEEVFHHGVSLLRKEEPLFDTFVTFFSLFWKYSFRLLDLPPLSSVQDRQLILEILGSSSSTNTLSNLEAIDVAKLRLNESPQLSIEESYFTKRLLRRLVNIHTLVLWWVGDDAMLTIIGSACPFLAILDLWKSSAVTDQGLSRLFQERSEDMSDPDPRSTMLSNTLRCLGLRETGVTHLGCFWALERCPNLEYLDFTQVELSKRLFLELRNALSIQSWGGTEMPTFSLKSLFVPLSDGTELKDVIRAFPNVEDLKLSTWALAPTLNLSNLSQEELPRLSCLVISGPLQSSRPFIGLLQTVGHQITTLKIETISTDIALNIIGSSCPNLEHLQVINSQVSTNSDDHDCAKASSTFLSQLKRVNFFSVQYHHANLPNVPSAIHCLLNHAHQLESVKASGCLSLDDQMLQDILAMNPLHHLEQFILTNSCASLESVFGHPLPLTALSVERLFSHCDNLHSLGDLQHWTVSSHERHQLSKDLGNRLNRGERVVLSH